MEVLEAIRSRRAVREYTDQPVERAMVEQLLDAAIQAPSAINNQPWAFVVIQDRLLLEEISELAKAYWLETTPSTPELAALREHLQDPTFNIFYNAGTLILICAKQTGMNPEEDCCLAAQNLMLAAHGMGLATCPIGLARPLLTSPNGKREVKIPEDYSVVFPIIVGYPRGKTSPTPRRTPEVLAWKA